jgi:PAS domain-containing protein
VQAISAARVSILIGLIYDCVAEPTLWSNAIRSICEDLHCMLGSILVWDLMNSNHRSIAGWNHEPFTTESISKYGEQVTAIYRSSETPFSLLLDEPLVISRDVPFAYHEDLPLYRDLVKPLGLCDSVQTIVLRDTKNKRLGVFAANRHVSAGLIEDRQVEILRLLAPHIRRAVTIGDLLNLNAALNESLASSLNMLRTALVLVSGSGRILHANDAAERMFRVGIHIRSRNGTLAAASSAANNELIPGIM